MMRTITLLSLFSCIVFGQEMKDNLFATLNSSSLHLFQKSEMQKMEVTSYRSSKKLGMVIETEATYRKGNVNPNKIRYSVKYTEYYILDDRRKSIGIYEIGEDNLFKHYERTDFNSRNMRSWAYEYDYRYQDQILSAETVTSIEYLTEGSAEVDTAHYIDSTLFTIKNNAESIDQYPQEDESLYTSYIVQDNRLIRTINHFSGFDETHEYTYDDQNRLIKIENSLRDEEGRSIYTYTVLKYNNSGLISEALFYDESDSMLERKEFTYK